MFIVLETFNPFGLPEGVAGWITLPLSRLGRVCETREPVAVVHVKALFEKFLIQQRFPKFSIFQIHRIVAVSEGFPQFSIPQQGLKNS